MAFLSKLHRVKFVLSQSSLAKIHVIVRVNVHEASRCFMYGTVHVLILKYSIQSSVPHKLGNTQGLITSDTSMSANTFLLICHMKTKSAIETVAAL